jgi:sugar lactone lactonase YvrE
VTTLALLLAGSATAAARGPAPDAIPLPPGWQPEGVASGPGNRLYVGSIPTGSVLRIDPRTSARHIVVPSHTGRAAVGLKVDRGRIFVAGGGTGRAFVYDARTGRDVADVALAPSPAFINDVTLAPRVAWFTDSARPQLYRLALRRSGAPAGRATTVPITGDLRYDDDPSTFEANGIAAAPGGRALLVVQSRTGGLFRVDPRTGASRRVTVQGGDLTNADGILLSGPRTLYVVRNQSNEIAVVRLAPNLSSAAVTRTIRDPRFDVPTTVARIGRNLFAVNARFSTPPTPATPYDVLRVPAR